MRIRRWPRWGKVWAIAGLCILAVLLAPLGGMSLMLWVFGEPEPMTSFQAAGLGLGSWASIPFLVRAAVRLERSMKEEPPASVPPAVCEKCFQNKNAGQCLACGYDRRGPAQAVWLFLLAVVPLALIAHAPTMVPPPADGTVTSEAIREVGWLAYVGGVFVTAWCACLWRRGRWI